MPIRADRHNKMQTIYNMIISQIHECEKFMLILLSLLWVIPISNEDGTLNLMKTSKLISANKYDNNMCYFCHEHKPYTNVTLKKNRC